jgi:hypothetical protein
MLRRAIRAAVVFGLLGIALGALGTSWRKPTLETIEDSDLPQRPVLVLGDPAIAAPPPGPTADAGFDRTVAMGQTVRLDGR